MRPSFFERTSLGFAPTGLPVSPWNSLTLNGVAIAGLLVAVLEESVLDLDNQSLEFARLTIDFFGATPLGELIPRFRVIRDGKRMQLLEVDLSVRGRVYARISALRVRSTNTPLSETLLNTPLPEAFASESPEQVVAIKYTERRVVRGRSRTTGSGAMWLRFDYEVISGEPLSPLGRAAMSADYPGGVGNMLVNEPYRWPNIDITIYMIREPIDDWILIEAITESSGAGSAVSSGQLYDRRGCFARTHQTIFVELA